METSFEKNTSSPNCVGHPHAENMKLYAEDAMTTNEPWKLWEVCMHGEWNSLLTNPAWNADRQYRRNPKQSTSMVLKFLNPSEMLLMMVKHTILLI